MAPIKIKETKEIEKRDSVTYAPVLNINGEPEVEEVEVNIQRFRVTTVFDISQTEGKPLPEITVEELSGRVDEHDIFIDAIKAISPVPIRFDEIERGAKGYYHTVNKEIVIQSSMSESQTMKTAIHEVSHAILHDRDVLERTGENKDRMTKEIEAESVAYTVCQYFGLDTAEYSFPYIAGWSRGKDLKELTDSMELIRKTAGDMIDNMEARINILKNERAFALYDKEIVYQTWNHYLYIQVTDTGYDYTIYDKNFRVLDGGVYDNPFLDLPHAVDEILGDVIVGFEDCQVINPEKFIEQVELVNSIKIQDKDLSILERLKEGNRKRNCQIQSRKSEVQIER